MRCACPKCQIWMIHAESDHLGCVCPECGARCTACLGTDSVVSRDSLKALADDPRFSPERFAGLFDDTCEETLEETD